MKIKSIEINDWTTEGEIIKIIEKKYVPMNFLMIYQSKRLMYRRRFRKPKKESFIPNHLQNLISQANLSFIVLPSLKSLWNFLNFV